MSRQERPEPGGSPGLNRRALLGMLGLTAGGVLLGDLMLGDGGPRPVVDAKQLPGPKMPKILSCDQWGAAKPSGDLNEITNRPLRLFVHHTAGPNERDQISLADLAKAIQKFHMQTNGWIDSGQHFTINRAGYVAEGRHRSLETLLGGRSFIEGAHARDQNLNSIGIENEGTYTAADPPAALLITLRGLAAFACVQYKIKPEDIVGHRDYCDTACPGDRLYKLLPTLRGAVKRMLDRASQAPMLGQAGDPAARASMPYGTSPGAAPAAPGATPAGSATPGPPAEPDSTSRLWDDPSLGTIVPISAPTWPLLRFADRGPEVLAAQHLLRNAGYLTVPTDGAFGRATADAVFAFQQRHNLDVTGMIGGGSWPLLAVPVRRGQGGEAEQAVQVLVRFGSSDAESTPDLVQRPTWQKLLGTG